MIRLLLLASVMALASCIAESGSGPRPIFENGRLDPAALGIWHAPAQGWILHIEPSGITRWQDTAAGCYATAPAGPDMPLMGQVEYTLFAPDPGGGAAGFQYLPGDQTTRHVRLDALPPACGAQDLSAEAASFAVFSAVMAEHYAFFAERGIDWAARHAAIAPAVRDGMGEPALLKAMAAMLDGLSDSHTKLIARVGADTVRIQDGQGDTLPFVRETMGETPWLIGLIDQLMTEVLDEGAVHTANERIVWGTIGGRIGYIQIFTMGGFTNGEKPGTAGWAEAELAAFDAVFDEALTAFEGLDAVILDLSNNRGGYDKIARRIASRFADTPFAAYTMDTDADGAPEHVYEITPAQGVRFTGPVHVLTSDVTVSGGEIATLSLRQLSHVTHWGRATRGSFSTPLAKPLPNGWYLELSSEVFAAPDGAVFEVTGIPPHRRIEVYPRQAPVAGHSAALQILIEAISS